MFGRNNGDKNIRAQIKGGYFRVIALTVLLAVVTIVCLFRFQYDYQVVLQNQTNRSHIQSAIVGHYEWLEKLNVSIQNGAEFTGSLDPTTCALGKWKAGVTEDDLVSPAIKTALDAADTPHNKIHNTVSGILALSKTDRESAYQQYVNDIKPQTAEVIAQLQVIDGCYSVAADAASGALDVVIIFSLLFTVVLTVGVCVFSLGYAERIARRISDPIVLVSLWAQKLSLGIEEENHSALTHERGSITEVNTLIEAFERMAQNIHENTDVVRRVAEGDMTAFVNIRSQKDCLGKNLYRMVQSNDLLFGNIVRIAHTVAVGSEEIAKASQTLAESATVQAASVEALSVTIAHANSLIVENSEKSNKAQENTLRIRNEAQESTVQLHQLVESVGNMQKSSERVSTVIKSIEDIAFQTNILALNAAVEAARAGVAGKGFAVVADEVRNLANKSAEASKESRALIEDTIRRTHESSQGAMRVSATFETILEEVNQIVGMIHGVADSSQQQLVGIQEVNREIDQISSAAAGNAAISEESAAASQEMRGNADRLRESMGSFTLRQRHADSAYIPPEKANDPEFIRLANEAYQKSRSTGQFGAEYIDPQGALLEQSF